MRYAGRAGRIPDSMYTTENIRRITGDMLEEAARHHVRYSEIRVGGRRGFTLLGVRGMLEAMAQAADDAERRLGVQSGFIVTIVRERGPEEAERLVAEAAACTDCRVVGIDLAGDEENFPPAIFSTALERARAAGLGITVHAGEFSGPASIWTAIYQLGAQRIGHGISALEDPDLLAHLRHHHVTLEICPTSNLRLGLVSSMEAHPLGRLLREEVPVTVSCDDPILLETDLSRELAAVATAFNLPMETLSGLMRAAASAAFLPADARAALDRQLVPTPTRG